MLSSSKKILVDYRTLAMKMAQDGIKHRNYQKQLWVSMRYAKTLLGLTCILPMLEFVLGLFKGNKLSSMTLLCCEAS